MFIPSQEGAVEGKAGINSPGLWLLLRLPPITLLRVHRALPSGTSQASPLRAPPCLAALNDSHVRAIWPAGGALRSKVQKASCGDAGSEVPPLHLGSITPGGEVPMRGWEWGAHLSP